jgi:Methyltransferase domain
MRTTTIVKPTASMLRQHVETSIELGDQMKSKLDRAAFQARGFTSPKVRHLLNNLGSLAGLDYLEVGVHRGATFVATNYKNTLASATAVDNWSEFADDGKVKGEFLHHCSTLLAPGSYRFLEQDCFSVTREQIHTPINFYLYDGEHSFEAQRKALTHFYALLDDVFIFLVDDYSWDAAKSGTEEAIGELGLERVFERELTEGWWNGLYVSVLKK